MNQPALSIGSRAPVITRLPELPRDISRRREHFAIHAIDWFKENQQLKNERDERLQCYEITWFTSAMGTLRVDTVIHKIKNNTIYCLVPGQVRTFNVPQDVQGYQISFSQDFLHVGTHQARMVSWLDKYDINDSVPMIEVDAEMQSDLYDIVRKMQKEYVNYYSHRSEILSGLLNILLIHFSRKIQVTSLSNNISKDADLVRKFRGLLKENFTTKKLVVDYANELCVTPNYLNRTVKKITGSTASHHIQQQIILEAKRQAIHSNGSMKEIAYLLGFDNLAHFSKFFKNNCGMNFTSFKKGLLYPG